MTHSALKYLVGPYLTLNFALLSLILAVMAYRIWRSRERQIKELVESGRIPHPAYPEYDDGLFHWEVLSEPVRYAVGTTHDQMVRMCKVPRHTQAAANRVAKGLRMAGLRCTVMPVTTNDERALSCRSGWQVTISTLE